MSPSDITTAPSPNDAPVKGFSSVQPSSPRAIWIRVILACTLLVGSGLLRAEQLRRVEKLLEEGKHSPFSLKDLPTELGPWKGEDTELDPRIAAGTGSVDHVFRRYVNQLTGTAVDVIVLYGPSTHMFIHAPERCYPAAGYTLGDGPDAQAIPLGEGRNAPFRSMVYLKGTEARPERQEVYYSWRYRNQWSPDVGNHKEFERIPGMYKVHLARAVTDHERREIDNPCRQLLTILVPEIERRAAVAQAKNAKAPMPDEPTSTKPSS